MTEPDRLANLRLAQRTIVARLDDPTTPPYSIAPLTNQLAYERWLRGPHLPARRKSPDTEHALAQDEIFRSWKAAEFELSPRRGQLEEWVEDMRAELQRCLEEAE